MPEINQVPGVVLGEPSFFPTIAAHADAPIIGSNRVELLFNGEQIFPAMLQAIGSARKSITYAQYLYEDGPIAYEIAEAFAERCRAGVQVKILLDDHGGSEMPEDIPALWKKSACHLEWFRRIRLFHELSLRTHKKKSKQRTGGAFVTRERLRLVLMVLVPIALVVPLIETLGFYLTAFLYLFLYIRWTGQKPWLLTGAISFLFPIAIYLVFEKWFLIPLPKGLMESYLPTLTWNRWEICSTGLNWR